MTASRASHALDLQRVRAAIRAADGDLVVAARALKMSTREVLTMLLESRNGENSGPLGRWSSGTRPRFAVDPATLGATDAARSSSDSYDRPAWTDDD